MKAPASKTLAALASIVTLAGCSAESLDGNRDASHSMTDGGGSSDGSSETDGGSAADASSSDGSTECGEAMFEVTETQESVIVPDGVRYMHVKAWGAGGNDERQCGETPDGGPGGFTEAVLEVTPGDELVVIVGRRGRAGLSGEDLFRFGFGAWGGGGLTGIFRGPGPITENDCDKALVIAGGGGSASAPECSAGIPGNHPDAGGASTMQGELPPDDDSPLGGGGGCEGGHAGASSVPSAGGTGYVAPEAIDQRILYGEPASNMPPRTDDPDYDGMAGQSELSGLLVLRYTCEPPPLI